jgi:hypothetical protein
MSKPLPWSGRAALLLLSLAGGLPLILGGQKPFHAPAQPQGRFHDWTTRHAIYPRVGTLGALRAVQDDPRAQFQWREIEDQQRLTGEFRGPRPWPLPRPPRPRQLPSGIHRDWSINLGTAGTAVAMYPAKFTFDVTATPSCANDFVVFPVAATGSATQPNLVAFNQLYSGTAGANGICNRTAVAGKDTGVAATVLWSYNIQGITGGAAVPTSPVLSLDGSRVAFVESIAGSAAHFHVLAWKSADGQVANLQNALSPKTITTFSANAPAAGSGAATDLTLGTASDTISSPFIDYGRDLAYVANDKGVVFRIKNVFCTISAACSGGTPPAPSLDTTWGTSGALTIGGTCVTTSSQLTGPVFDSGTQNVYVGCADGKLYRITQAGTVTSLAVGDGVGSKTFGAIVDAPVVDGVNGFVYVTSGSAGGGANGVLVQAKLDLSAPVAVPIGAGNQCNIHSPAFSNAYFTSPTNAASIILVGGVTGTVGPCTAGGATGGAAVLYGATFGAGGVLNTGAPAHSLTSGNPVGSEFAPIGEFFNPNIGAGQDTIFVSILRNNSSGFVNLYSFNVTAGWNATVLNSATEGLGGSGMVVDNSALTTAGNFPQASSFYFNALDQNATCTSPQTGANTNGCAVKLTQAALQ